MSEATEETSFPATTENFAELLEESFAGDGRLFGKVVTGSVVSVENDFAIVDVGLKSEGTVPIREFRDSDGEINVQVGDQVDVFVERIEDRNGVVILSRDKARREEAWTVLEKAFEKQERVNGIIFGRVKGGFTVDLAGAVAVLHHGASAVHSTNVVRHPPRGHRAHPGRGGARGGPRPLVMIVS